MATLKKDLKKIAPKASKVKALNKGGKGYDRLGRIYKWGRELRYEEKKSKGVTVVKDIYMQYHSKTGKSKWNFFKSFQIGQQFKGLKNPTKKELDALIAADKKTFFRAQASNILGTPSVPKLAAKPDWFWKSENKLSVFMEVEYEKRADKNKIEKIKHLVRLEMWRKGLKQPWQFKPRWRQGVKPDGTLEREVLSTREVPAQEIDKMQTYYVLQQSEAASAAQSKLPKLTLPVFDTPQKLAVELYKYLHIGDDDKTRAFLLNTLHPRFFISPGLLHPDGEALIKKTLNASKSPIKFSKLFCLQPRFNTKRSSGGSVYLKSAKIPKELGGDVTFKIEAGSQPGKFVNGKRTAGEFKLTQIIIGKSGHKDTEQYLDSITDRLSICN